MKDNRLLKVLWGIVLAIFLCSALFLAISYFSGGDNASKKKDNNTTSTSKSKDKEKEEHKLRWKTFTPITPILMAVTGAIYLLYASFRYLS